MREQTAAPMLSDTKSIEYTAEWMAEFGEDEAA